MAWKRSGVRIPLAPPKCPYLNVRHVHDRCFRILKSLSGGSLRLSPLFRCRVWCASGLLPGLEQSSDVLGPAGSAGRDLPPVCEAISPEAVVVKLHRRRVQCQVSGHGQALAQLVERDDALAITFDGRIYPLSDRKRPVNSGTENLNTLTRFTPTRTHRPLLADRVSSGSRIEPCCAGAAASQCGALGEGANGLHRLVEQRAERVARVGFEPVLLCDVQAGDRRSNDGFDVDRSPLIVGESWP